MREILFRGKRIDNGEWVYGDYWHLPEKNFYCISDKEFNRKVTPETVGQYTGLTDKNGKKIFEGDIIHVKDLIRCPVGFGNCLCIADYIASVAFDDCRFCLLKANGGIYEIPLDSDKIEVIGNIHDNPELLEADE